MLFELVSSCRHSITQPRRRQTSARRAEWGEGSGGRRFRRARLLGAYRLEFPLLYPPPYRSGTLEIARRLIRELCGNPPLGTVGNLGTLDLAIAGTSMPVWLQSSQARELCPASGRSPSRG